MVGCLRDLEFEVGPQVVCALRGSVLRGDELPSSVLCSQVQAPLRSARGLLPWALSRLPAPLPLCLRGRRSHEDLVARRAWVLAASESRAADLFGRAARMLRVRYGAVVPLEVVSVTTPGVV
jgi:hypothetical protein